MGHEVVGQCAVPVLLARWSVHGVAGPHHHDLAAGGDDAEALGDVQRLAETVAVPGGAGARGEAHGVHPYPRVTVAAGDDGEAAAGVTLRLDATG
jgi:hypothetical protein